MFVIWAPSSEFVSLSIPSWQTLTAHAQPFRGARDLAFCLKVPLDSLLVWASSEGSGETARMRRLAWTFAARIDYKYQIRLTRSICNKVLWKYQYLNNSGPYAEGLQVLRSHSPTSTNYFKIMQFFTRNWVYTPNFGLKIGIFLRFAPPVEKSAYGPVTSGLPIVKLYSTFTNSKWLWMSTLSHPEEFYQNIRNWVQVKLAWSRILELGVGICKGRFDIINFFPNSSLLKWNKLDLKLKGDLTASPHPPQPQSGIVFACDTCFHAVIFSPIFSDIKKSRGLWWHVWTAW